MPKPRYDEEEDKSRHAVADTDCCEEIAQKYNWRLVNVEETDDNTLPFDCVFEGRTEFSKSYYDVDEDKNDA